MGVDEDKSGLDIYATTISADPLGKNSVRKVDNDDEMVAYRKQRVKQTNHVGPVSAYISI